MEHICHQTDKLSFLDKTLSLNDQALSQMKEDLFEVKTDMREIKEKIGYFATRDDIENITNKLSEAINRKAEKSDLKENFRSFLFEYVSKATLWAIGIVVGSALAGLGIYIFKPWM